MNPLLKDWTPGADEAARFCEDLYRRILGTTQIMRDALDCDTARITEALRHATNVTEDRAAIEYEKVDDLAEHERFVYNWALVMLTSRTVGALITMMRALDKILPDHQPSGKSELVRITNEFRDRCNIILADAPTRINFLEGIVLVRNKIVHNSALLYERSSDPNPILVEGEAPWGTSDRDQDFIRRFPEYVDGQRIIVTKQVFEERAKQALAFIAHAAQQFDLFIHLLTSSTNTRGN